MLFLPLTVIPICRAGWKWLTRMPSGGLTMVALLASLFVFIIVTIVTIMTPRAANLLAAASGAQVGLRSSLGLLS
jgi:hypothetical protein